MNKANYRFAETLSQHARRLGGNQHRTRQLRRAILHLLTGREYSELAGYLVAQGLEELLKKAAVKLDDNGALRPYGEPSDKEFLTALTGKLFERADPSAPQRKKLEMLSQGLFQGNIPYPYSGHSGYIVCNEKTRSLVIDAFATLAAGGSYTDVASMFNEMEFPTATGRRWSRDAARSFCQNPIHAGYAVTYKDRNPDGTANKRGGMILTRLSKGFPDPPLLYDEWYACNLVMREREIILVHPSA